MYILFDIGGTRTRLAVSGDGETVGEPRIVPTPSGFEEGVALITSYYLKISQNQSVDGVCGGFPGVFNKQGIIVKAANLPSWVGKPLLGELKKLTPAPVLVENDADLAGLGEAVRGAGQGYRIVAYITVSTGFGGTRIVDGKVDVSGQGFEPGHQIIDYDASLFPEAADGRGGMKVGYLENYVSGKYLNMRFGKEPAQIADAAVWDIEERLIAAGLNNIIVHWSPDVIVVGGGVTTSGKISLDKIRDHLENLLRIFPEVPEIKMTQLGDSAALYGGLELLKRL
jgi:predicted NBD/HSP70 family sugar kinase